MVGAILIILRDDWCSMELFVDVQLTRDGGRVLPGSSATKQGSQPNPWSKKQKA